MVLPIVLGTIAGQVTTPADTTGTYMYVQHGQSDVLQFTLSTPWDLSTASYTATSDVSLSLPREFTLTHAGTNGYIVSNTADKIYRYALSTAWDVTTIDGTADENFDVSGKEVHPYGLEVKGDGTSIYVLGYSSDKVHQWDMSTANDLSTASYHGYISTSSESNAAGGLAFSLDGTKMYTGDQLNDEVHEYTLSTAWDVTTASHENTLDVSAKESVCDGVAISTDGTKLYIVGSGSDDVNEYTLSTAYDISTASHSHTLDISSNSNFPMSVCFNMTNI